MPISTAGTGVVSARLYSNVVTPRSYELHLNTILI
jgi:hypothetical protein